jgi:hypothetical protein
MTKERATQLALFVRDDLNNQEEIDFVLMALQRKTCKENYSEETHCKECPWNWGGLCRLMYKYEKMTEEKYVIE